VRLVSGLEHGLHERVGGVPQRDEIGERQGSEAIAEVAVADVDLWDKRVNVHGAHLNKGEPEMLTMLPIAGVNPSRASA
jgi:hypothetical protein